jgi:MFS family permease
LRQLDRSLFAARAPCRSQQDSTATLSRGARTQLVRPRLSSGRFAVAPTTLLLWLLFFISPLDLFFLASWLARVLNDLGASIAAAARIGAMFQIGGVIGTVGLGTLIDRCNFRAPALTYLTGAVAIAAIGQGRSFGEATAAIFAAGFCIVGGIAAGLLAAVARPRPCEKHPCTRHSHASSSWAAGPWASASRSRSVNATFPAS